MYDRFTDRARKCFQLANQEALKRGSDIIGTEHLLMGLIDEGTGVAVLVLKKLGVDSALLRSSVEERSDREQSSDSFRKAPQTPRLKLVIESAITEARALGHDYVGTEHLLLGLLSHLNTNAAQALVVQGLSLATARQKLAEILGPPPDGPSVGETL
jgi:ATP-dependent Clp protease ATP-binding subunit ClpC